MIGGLRSLPVNQKWQKWISETRSKYLIFTMATWNQELVHFIKYLEHKVRITGRQHGFTKNKASKIRVISFMMVLTDKVMGL